MAEPVAAEASKCPLTPSTTAGAINVPILEPDADQNFGGVALTHPWRQTEAVPCYTIDALQLGMLHLLKADVEGMEPEVIAGARETIRRHTPILYLESDRVDRRADLVRELNTLDYVAFWHSPPLFHPQNFANNAENIFADIVSQNWLCVHRSQVDALASFERVNL